MSAQVDPQQLSSDQAYQRGYQDGLAGAQQVCLDHVDADGQAAYDKGYAAGKADRPRQRMQDRLTQDIGRKDEKAVLDDLDEAWSTLNMNGMLDLFAALKKAGVLQQLENYLDERHWRSGMVFLTITGPWDQQWQDEVAKLQQEDRDAVLARVPAGTYTGPQAKPQGKAKSDDDEDDDNRSVETDVSSKLETIATATLIDAKNHSKVGEFGVEAHVGAKGRLASVEADVTLFQQKLKTELAGVKVVVSVTISLNAGVEFNTDVERQDVVDKFNAGIKTELKIRFGPGYFTFSDINGQNEFGIGVVFP